MLDKNGIELKTGDVVLISGAYFKKDNGYHFITHSPGDANWLAGNDFVLRKISKTGKILTSKYKNSFWPIWPHTNNYILRWTANEWNSEHAQIEVISDFNRSEIKEYFKKEYQKSLDTFQRHVKRFGPNDSLTKERKAIVDHYLAISERIS